MVFYTNRIDEAIIDGYAAGTPVREIAERFGLTRYQVIGRANRIGVAHTRRKSGKARPPAPVVRGLLLEDLPARGCRYPVHTEGRTHTFCGADRAGESPYCAPHHDRCYDGARRDG